MHPWWTKRSPKKWNWSSVCEMPQYSYLRESWEISRGCEVETPTQLSMVYEWYYYTFTQTGVTHI